MEYTFKKFVKKLKGVAIIIFFWLLCLREKMSFKIWIQRGKIQEFFFFDGFLKNTSLTYSKVVCSIKIHVFERTNSFVLS